MADLTFDRATVLSDYLAAPDRLAQVVAGLDAVTLDRALTADTWTIRQLVHHIVDGDAIWNVGIKAALGNPDGDFTLQWYWDVPQTTWAERWCYADRDVQPSLGLFKANRRHIAQLLEAVPEAWDRGIMITCRGREDERAAVAEIVTMQARHALGHIDEIVVILSKERQAH